MPLRLSPEYLGLILLAGFLIFVAYALWLGYMVLWLGRKLDRLYRHCASFRQRLAEGQIRPPEREGELSDLWEAVHHHEHGPKKRADNVIKFIGKS